MRRVLLGAGLILLALIVIWVGWPRAVSNAEITVIGVITGLLGGGGVFAIIHGALVPSPN